jgi:hypothetical protein
VGAKSFEESQKELYAFASNDNELEIAVNENGQTYGSNLAIKNSKMDEDGNPDELDLILVEADNGKAGYSLKEDFYDTANQPKNPEEAIAYMEKLKKEGDRTIPIYEKDGRTVIGSFKIGNK